MSDVTIPPTAAIPPSNQSSAGHSQSEIRELILPPSVIGRVDTGRLLREIEAFDESMHQAELKGDSTASLPATGRVLTEFTTINKLDLKVASNRKHAVDFVTTVHSSAPVLHMSFSAEPSQIFMTKIVVWLRREIHPLTLVQVGLQPSIGAGCIVRTTNKYFDFSLRERFKQKREQLLNFFSRANTIAEPAQTQAPEGTAQT